jgi:phage replication initiation protein
MKKQISLEIKGETLVPPASNTEAQSTGQRILLDWVAFTLPYGADIFTVLGIPAVDWVSIPSRALGYTQMFTYGDMRVYTSDREDMGIHCELSGSACRAYEFFLDGRWNDLIKRVRESSGHFSRIDLAIDDFDGMFELNEIKEKVQNGEVVSLFRRGRILKEYNLGFEDNLGETIYFGSTQSRIRIRMYDKAIEHLIKDQKSRESDAIMKESGDKVPRKLRQEFKQCREEMYRQERLNCEQIWIRTEIQGRDERAEEIANHIISQLEIGSVVFGILKHYLNFVDKNMKDSNKSRWEVSAFWQKFLGEVEKVKLTTAKQKRTIKQVKDWIIRQVAPSLALLSLDKTFRVDLEEIVQIILFAKNRLTKRHYQMVLNS